jgi:long-chain acyl-CoA synthetase
MIKENLVKFIENSLKENWECPALSDYKGERLTYKQVAEKISRLHVFFEHINIERGDKISLIGKNSSSWAITYLATITYGAVIVPILPEFKPKDIQNIINHSDSVILFASDQVLENISLQELPNIKAVLSLTDGTLKKSTDKLVTDNFNNIEKLFDEKYRVGLSPEILTFETVSNDMLAVISYTSGTTGFSKGVMLQHNSLAANIRFARNNMPLQAGDSIV